MTKRKAKLKHEGYIETRPGVPGGAPVITGAGIKVLDVAVRYELMRMTPEEIMLALPHLTLPQVHSALSCYYAHKAELDKQWKASIKRVARLRARTASILEEKLGPIKIYTDENVDVRVAEGL
jgi:uncharacterized protein (DUF433 family)